VKIFYKQYSSQTVYLSSSLVLLLFQRRVYRHSSKPSKHMHSLRKYWSIWTAVKSDYRSYQMISWIIFSVKRSVCMEDCILPHLFYPRVFKWLEEVTAKEWNLICAPKLVTFYGRLRRIQTYIWASKSLLSQTGPARPRCYHTLYRSL